MDGCKRKSEIEELTDAAAELMESDEDSQASSSLVDEMSDEWIVTSPANGSLLDLIEQLQEIYDKLGGSFSLYNVIANSMTESNFDRSLNRKLRRIFSYVGSDAAVVKSSTDGDLTISIGKNETT